MVPKILVVDDEPDLEHLVKQKFRREIKENKYNFFFANNGVQALEKLNEDKNIELVLTDINMPVMDGLTLLKNMKELNNPLLHSVFISAYGDIVNIRTAMNGGAFDFVVKPIDLTDLEITIKKALDNLNTLKKALEARDALLVVQKELHDARELQLSMLPKNLPNLSNLDIAVYMKTATEVGGDYYDFHTGEDGTLTTVIGDATGHGLKAGMMVTAAKTLFNSYSKNDNILDIFQEMTRSIKQMKFNNLAMCLAMLKITKNKLVMSSAGMPSIYIYRKEKGIVEEFEFQGMPLGTLENFPYKSAETEINSGDTIFLTSDGFPELKNANNEMFGYKRVRSLFENLANESPEAMISKLKDTGSDWVNDKDPDDDVTFVVIKVK